jgi:hypothetical protein
MERSGDAAQRQDQGVSARLEYEFKLKQAERPKELAPPDAALEKLKEETEVAVRTAKRADLDEVDLHRERELAAIRSEEEIKRLEGLNRLVAALKDMPVPSFDGVQTVVQSGIGAQNTLPELLQLVLTHLLNQPVAERPGTLTSAGPGSRV